MGLETCFPFLIHSWPIRARDVSDFKITKKNRKSVISPILQEIFLIIWMKKYDEKHVSNGFLCVRASLSHNKVGLFFNTNIFNSFLHVTYIKCFKIL